MRHIPDAERRARLGVRHHLARRARASELVAVAADLVGLHATDPVTIFLAARARTTGLTVATVERALYDDRTLLKTLAMRRTMFVVPTTMAALLQSASSDAVAATERRRLAKQLETDGVAADGSAWLDEVIPLVVAELQQRGEATAAELNAAIEPMRAQLTLAPGKRYEAVVNAGTRVLVLAAAEGRIVRGRPIGSWVSTQYRWAPMSAWRRGVVPPLPTVAAAREELARRWLSTFGPASSGDLQWWTGWGKRDTNAALGAIGAVEVTVDPGVQAFVVPGDEAPVRDPKPWVALLPSLDPTAMGWKARDWYLGPHKDDCFDTMGNIGPTVWVDGRIVGGWAQRTDGEIVVCYLEGVDGGAETAIEDERAALQAWLGETRYTPRFPSPLDRRLRA
jgi:Winged helix DNA-binding domain